VAGLLLGWEVAGLAGLVDPFYFPPVHRITLSLGRALADGTLPTAVGVTLLRGFAGYGLAAVLGITVGVLAGRHRLVHDLIEPLVEFLRPLPSPAIIPVAILLLGIGSSMKVFIVAWACFFPILLNTVDGVRGISPALIETAQNLGLGYWRTLLTVILPAASPVIFTGLRVSLGIMLILAVIAEMVAGNTGIGFLLLDAERSFNVAGMYGFIVALAGVGYLLNRLFLAVDRRVLAWHRAMHRVETL
jgi:ABC-type nitrate/sulfonate/bicarbonate transport system permease component